MCGKCDKNTTFTKECNACYKVKSLFEFGSDNENIDKHRGKCKECRKTYQKIKYENNKNDAKEFSLLKQCSKCKIIKCNYEFGMDNSKKTGLKNQCSECCHPFVFELIVPENKFLRQCDSCKEIKLLDEFPKSFNGANGIRNICKICDYNRTIASRINIKNSEKEYVEFKYCTGCKIEHHRSEFSTVNYIKTGLKSTCKIYDKIFKYELKEYVEFKECKICAKIKYRDEFSKNSYSKDELESWCRLCIKEYNAQPHIRKQALIRGKKYSADNRSKINQAAKKRAMEKRASDPLYVLRSNVSRTIRHYLKLNNSSKNGNSALEFLPYTITELRTHIESQWLISGNEWMNWNNYGKISSKRKTWQIDHITPQSLLPYDSMEHPNFQKSWTLSNLRPLEAFENIRKSNKLISNINTEYLDDIDFIQFDELKSA